MVVCVWSCMRVWSCVCARVWLSAAIIQGAYSLTDAMQREDFTITQHENHPVQFKLERLVARSNRVFAQQVVKTASELAFDCPDFGSEQQQQ